jgi:gamma-glutamylcyclotransferase (GGCT)/AIG2-like uncharacterized protein YtfP
MLYFGFGSNLNAGHWQDFCRRKGFPGAMLEPVGPALALDREITFDIYVASSFGGAANLRPRLGQAAPGMLFRINEETITALEKKEHAPRIYRRLDLHVIRPDGTAVECLTYMADNGDHVPPHEDYAETVREGARDHGLDTAQLDAAAAGEEPPLLAPRMFVYGTLRKDQPNAHLLDGLSFEPAKVPGLLFDHGPYPLMTLGDGVVSGEVVPLDPARLQALDALEAALPFGAPGGSYRRTVLPATLADGSVVPAQLYVVEDAKGAPAVPSGDWLSLGDRRGAWAAYRAGGGG